MDKGVGPKFATVFDVRTGKQPSVTFILSKSTEAESFGAFVCQSFPVTAGWVQHVRGRRRVEIDVTGLAFYGFFFFLVVEEIAKKEKEKKAACCFRCSKGNRLNSRGCSAPLRVCVQQSDAASNLVTCLMPTSGHVCEIISYVISNCCPHVWFVIIIN